MLRGSRFAAGSSPPGRRDAVAVCAGLLIAAGLAAADAAAGRNTVFVSAVVLAPFVVALFAGPRETGLVAAVTVTLALVSAVWDHDFDTWAYWLRGFVVAAGGVVAVVAAAGRQRMALERERSTLLAAAVEAFAGTGGLAETAAGLCDLLVPAAADACVVDGVQRGSVQRLAVRPDGFGDALNQRGSEVLEAAGTRAALENGAPQLAARVDAPELRPLGVGSALSVPLVARGRTLGALTLLATDRSRRRYTHGDLDFAHALGGRVALALDNAGLFSELETIEAELAAALGALADAVTMQRPDGRVVYANEAAARLYGFGSPQELVAAPYGTFAEHFEFRCEDGSPLRPEDFPRNRLLAGKDAPPVLVRTVPRADPARASWQLVKAAPVRDASGAIAMVVNIMEEVSPLKQAELAQRLLADAGDVLASSLDYRRTLQRVAELTVPELADWCTISLPDGSGRLRPVAVAVADPEKAPLARQLADRFAMPLGGQSASAEAFRSGRPQCLNDMPADLVAELTGDAGAPDVLGRLGAHAALVAPMTTAGRSIGTIRLVSTQPGREFFPGDVDLAAQLARRVALAVENARLYDERSHVAETLETSLLPAALPELPGWRTATLYRPAGDASRVGGDFYDAFPIEGGWMVVVGDVCGHGVEAAALTALMRHTLRTAATVSGSPTEALDKLNRELVARSQLTLATAVCVVLNHGAGEGISADIVCAGHPKPILIRDGALSYLGQFGPMPGAYADEKWDSVAAMIRDGDVLVLYTDGVIDTVGADGRFGPQRLEEALRGARTADDAVKRVDAALLEFQDGEQPDDTAVLAIERTPVRARFRPATRPARPEQEPVAKPRRAQSTTAG